MGKQNNTDTDTRLAILTNEFFKQQQEFKKAEAAFNEAKAEYEDEMEGYMAKRKTVKFDMSEYGFAPIVITVKKIERTTIEWFAEKLEKRVDKKTAKKVIHKEYRIRNMPMLVKYLKSCGVDPKVFKSFIEVEKSVDVDAVELLGDTGQLSAERISGCYIVKCSKPYFRLSAKEVGNNGDDEQ